MISPQSMHNVEVAFQDAVRMNLVRESGDVCKIVSVAAGDEDAGAGQKLLLITISSFVFRLIVMFRLVDNPITRAYFLRVDAVQTLDEVFAELANMCGGTLNRALSAQFPHLALSTPSTVNGQCAAFLDDLRPQHVARFRITINDSVRLQAALCMCCSRPVEVADATSVMGSNETIGELELF